MADQKPKKVTSPEMAKIASEMMSVGRDAYSSGADYIPLSREQLENVWSLCGSVLSQVE